MVIQGVRMSWNRFNLYHLARLRQLPIESLTFYQQKWKAKAMTRFYHGELVGEKRWERMFKRRINAVVPMSPQYMAAHDGSDESAGRGSGLEKATKRRPNEFVPYTHMLYAQMERRLDTAVFRALFASSIRQARQFVLRGCVKVNGQEAC